MSHLSKEISTCDNSPVMLYQFVNDLTTWRYTSIGQDITAGGYTWTSAPSIQSEMRQSDDVDKCGMTVDVPITSSVAVFHLGDPPPYRTFLTVFSTHFDDAEVLMEWKGSVARHPINEGVMTFECKSIGDDLDGEGLRMRAQRMCPHVLFGPGCNLNRADFARACYATSLTGNVVLVPMAALMTDIVGGTISACGQIRTITANNLGQLTLAWPILGLADAIAAGLPGPGAAVNVYPHCRRSTLDCDTKFGNKGNHGGQARMAGVDPFDVYSLVW